ncbi:MAG: hypothetical protein V4635_09460 [Bacteroidota bacterium]
MDNNKLRDYIRKTLEEAVDSPINEDEHELINAADKVAEKVDSDEVEEGMGRSISLGRGVNQKPNNYPENLKRGDI